VNAESSSGEAAIREGQILTGPLFSEPMRVETVRADGADAWVAGLVGLRSEQFRRVTLRTADLAGLTITDTGLSYDGDGRLLRLALQAYSLGIAYEFDPYFGLSISRVDPLPHQLEAVYEYLLKLPRVRFLLADDAGAGKTIMAGPLIRELKLRGLADRVLVVCPANLTFQWQRELKEKFDEKFLVLKGGDIRDQFGVNQWLEQKQIITSLDLAKRTEILPGLRQVPWDLVVVDEAHRMSWSPPARKTPRYALGELLRDSSNHILLLTATPHKGDPQNFTLFLQLFDPDAYAAIPTINDEDAKRPNRERENLVGEQNRIINRMKATLTRLGIRGFNPKLKNAAERLDALRTPEGEPIPPNTLAELRRDMMRRRLVKDQIRQIEDARLERIGHASGDESQAMLCLLARVIGVGIETADMLVQEVLSRNMRDRRAVARYAGLTGSPAESGTRRRERGLARSGNARVRRGMIQLAWRFLMFQKDSALARWYRERTEHARGMRKTMIVALARKLLIALWRLVREGVVPEGVVLRAAN
jgi:transposase